MTQNDASMPPLPPRVPPASPPPWHVARPIPVQAIHYRPGVLSAISVIGIVIACLSTIASLMSGCQAGTFYMMSKMSSTMKSSAAATTASTGSSITIASGGSMGSVVLTPVASTPAGMGAATQPAAGTTMLTAAEISGAVQRAQSASGNKLTTAQTSALATALQDPNQQLISPGTAWSPVRMAQVNPDGSAFVYLSGGFATLSPQGQITSSTVNNTMPNFNVGGTICILAGLDALLSIGLAIFLFIAAIVVMRNSPSGRRLHLIYAMLKIPVAVVGGFTLASMYSQFYGSIGAGVPGGAASIKMMVTIWAMIICGLGLIYPIALLIAFNTRGVREFYNPVRG